MLNLESLMIAITTLGSPEAITFLCIVLAVFLLVHKKPKHFLQFTIFMSLGALSIWLLKQWLQITRPDGGILEVAGYSFPSGHAAMSTLFFSLLIYSYMPHIKSIAGKGAAILLGLIAAGAISYSRLYLGVHTVSDVVGGISIGAIWFILSVVFFRSLKKKRRV